MKEKSGNISKIVKEREREKSIDKRPNVRQSSVDNRRWKEKRLLYVRSNVSSLSLRYSVLYDGTLSPCGNEIYISFYRYRHASVTMRTSLLDLRPSHRYSNLW